MSNTTKGKRGRPKLGNVLFARRLPPAKIAEIEALLSAEPAKHVAGTADRAAEANAGNMVQPDKAKAQIAQLLENIDALTKEVEELRVLLEEARAEGLDDKGAYWRARALEAEKNFERCRNGE